MTSSGSSDSGRARAISEYEVTIAEGGSFGGLDTESYGRLNPNRKVPTDEDGDLVVWESNACVRYLAARDMASMACRLPMNAMIASTSDGKSALLCVS